MILYAQRKRNSPCMNYDLFIHSSFTGSSLYLNPMCRQLANQEPVNALVILQDNKILAACGNTLYEVSAVKNMMILVGSSFECMNVGEKHCQHVACLVSV